MVGSTEEDLRELDEKIRSLITTIAFLFAGSIAVFYTATSGQTRLGTLSPSFTWDGYPYAVDHILIVLIGFALFMALTFALVALDPDTARPKFVTSASDARDAPSLLRFKKLKFGDCQVFLTLAMMVIPLLGLARIPGTADGTRTGLMMGTALLYVWLPLLRAGLIPMNNRSLLFHLVPALLATGLLVYSIGHSGLRLPALLYALSWTTASRWLQLRSDTTALVGAGVAVLLWLVAVGLGLGYGSA